MANNSALRSIPHTTAKAGRMVTTISRLDGVGVGYVVDGSVYVTTGSFWATLAENDVFGLVGIIPDGGNFYMSAIRGAKVTDEIRDNAQYELGMLNLWG